MVLVVEVPLKSCDFFTKISTIPSFNELLLEGTATTPWVLTCPYLLLFFTTNKQQDNKKWTKLNNQDLPTKFYSKCVFWNPNYSGITSISQPLNL